MLELELDMVKKIGQAAKDGEWPREAAVRYGATRTEFEAWWEAGEEAIDAPPGTTVTEHQRLCGELVRVVRQAESECENNWRKLVARGDRGVWTAYMTLLERRFPDRWRKREMTGGGKVGVFDPDAEMRRLHEKKRPVDDAADDRRQLGG